MGEQRTAQNVRFYLQRRAHRIEALSTVARLALWRCMKPSDLDGVVRVAHASFPDHFEDRSCFAERLMLYPRGCFSLVMDRAIVGYLMAYPWIAGSVAPLNSLILRLPTHPDLIYLHDLALQPCVRGFGYAPAIMERLVAQARSDRWQQIALVAVNHATAFWLKMSFEVIAKPPCLTSYGDTGAYMVRQLTDQASPAGCK